MKPTIIETDVPLQLVINETETSGQVVLKIPPRTRIVVGETIQIKRKLPNRKRQESSIAPQPNSMEDQVDENLDDQRSIDRLSRSHFSLDASANECKEPLVWNNIQLKPDVLHRCLDKGQDVYTGQLTPMPSQWNHVPEDHNWYIPLPPLDLHLYTGTEDDFVIPNEDLTPSSKQIIDEIRDMNAWNNESTFSDDEIQNTLENDQTDSDDDTDVQIDQLELCEESFSLRPDGLSVPWTYANADEEYLNKQVQNERSDSLDTNEVLSEFDVCDKV